MLAVDDEPDALHLVKEVLTRSSATVYTAGDPYQALKLFEQEKPGVVVSDIGMPGMDRFELVRRIVTRRTAVPCPPLR